MPRSTPLAVRFWQHATAGAPNDCWPWRGARNDADYGLLRAEPPQRRMLRAHRVAWELARGAIPVGMECDHLCRNPACVNPAHLALVTHAENTRRGFSPPAVNARRTHCRAGHLYDEANTYVSPDGARQCKTCRREWQRAKRRAYSLECHQ